MMRNVFERNQNHTFVVKKNFIWATLGRAYLWLTTDQYSGFEMFNFSQNLGRVTDKIYKLYGNES